MKWIKRNKTNRVKSDRQINSQYHYRALFCMTFYKREAIVVCASCLWDFHPTQFLFDLPSSFPLQHILMRETDARACTRIQSRWSSTVKSLCCAHIPWQTSFSLTHMSESGWEGSDERRRNKIEGQRRRRKRRRKGGRVEKQVPRWLAGWLASRKPYPYSPLESPLALCLSRNFTSADSLPDSIPSFLLSVAAKVQREFYVKTLAWLSINFKSLGQSHIFYPYRCVVHDSVKHR